MLDSILKLTEFAKFKIVLIIQKTNQKIRQIRHEIKNRRYQFHKINLSI